MKEMASLAKALKIIIHFISHLATPEGKSHEEGGHVSIRHFKGARAIGFWAHFMFGLERNQQSEDPEERSTTLLRILKDRYTGQATGELIFLGYDRNTGRLFEKDGPAKAFKDETETEAEALAF
jgi:twinkle protein